VALKEAVLIDPGHALPNEKRRLMLGSLALCWLGLGFFERVTQGNPSVSRRELVIGRALSAAVLIGVGLLGKHWIRRGY
jgi:hypothetical protein